jgi:hypothetical protein
VFNSPFGAFDAQRQNRGDAVMPNRRQVATRAIVAAGVYLHPNYNVGDQDKRLTAMQSDFADMDADFLKLDVGKAPVVGRCSRKLNFEVFDDTTMT